MNTHIYQALNWAADFLQNQGIENSQNNAELLLRYVLGISKAQLFIDSQELIPATKLAQFKELVKIRATHFPLQYITGIQEFMGLEIIVNRKVLIPRPETEILVEAVLERAKNWQEPPTIIDLGTGAGPIAISLAKLLPLCRVYATDISSEALQVAKLNLQKHQVENRVILAQGDIFEPLEEFDLTGKVNCIVSNLPYVPANQIDELQPEVKLYEPRVALDGGEDGLKFFPQIAQGSRKFLKPNGFIACELGAGQAESVKRIFKNAGFHTPPQIIPDYNGLERVIIAKVSSQILR